MDIENFNQERTELDINPNEPLSLNLNINIIKTRSSSTIAKKLSCSTIDSNISSSSQTIKSNFNLETFFTFDYNDIFDTFSNEINEEEKMKYKVELIYNILSFRKQSAIKISNFLKAKYNRMKFRKELLIKQIVEKRKNLIIRLQKNIKSFIVKKNIKKILNCEYVFFYRLCPNLLAKLSIDNNKNILNKENIVQCKIFSRPFQNKKFSFIYCRFLNCYYLPLIHLRILKNKYRVNFIVNNETIIDSRYQVDTDNKGNFYNIIIKKMIFRFKKIDKDIEIQNNFNNYNSNNKYWESIFEIKKVKRPNSYDSLSISNSNISNEPNTAPVYESEISNKSNIKSILKNPLKKVESIGDHKNEKKNRNVSFSNKIMYCY